ncbi:MAG: glycoside hydrolase family 43 protein [Phocaeicola sp.]
MRKLTSFICFLLLTTLFIKAQSGTLSSVRTYTNPVMPGFFPDPSTIRVGDDYYTINSTFQYFPGLVISHSKDLVNWKQESYVFNDENPIDLTHYYDGCGVWAPDISYYNGEFYVFYCLVQLKKDRSVNVRGNYMTKSKSIYGPWSAPVQLTDYGNDPSHFVDDNGEHYMLFAAGIPTGNGTQIVKLNRDCTQIVEGPFWMTVGGKKAAPEAPHLLKKDDYYYFMMAASSGEFDGHHQLLARSKNIYGPYEMHPQSPFIAQYNQQAINKHQGHGKFFKTQHGDWYITVITQRRDETDFETSYAKKGISQLGRETSLYPVRWEKDGWPYVMVNGQLADSFTYPDLPYSPLQRVQNDDFNDSKLAIQWLNVRNPIYEERSLIERPGYLRLYTGNFTLDDIQARNIVVQRETSKNYRATTQMEFSPQSSEQAGLVCYYDTQTYISFSLRKEKDGELKLVLEEKRGRERIQRVVNEVRGIQSSNLYLRVQVTHLKREFFYSYDNQAWSRAGTIENAAYLSDEGTPEWNFTGTMVGLYALNYGTGVRLAADFNSFNMEVDPMD